MHDTESGLYYLQSRYYDPKIGRFINADALVSTCQGILGNNMFAYCNNNPVSLADPEGNLPGGIINPNAMARNSGGSLHPISDKDQAKQRINTNENAVLKAEQYAYYKGVLYLKVPGDSAFSFGIVFFGSEIDDANLVRHEYGHTRQLAKLGNSDYLRYVSIATCGAGAAIFISAAGGAITTAANSAYTQYTLTGDIDAGKVMSDALIGGITNGLCTGTSSCLDPVVKGLKNGFRYAGSQVASEFTPGLLNVGSFVVNDFIPTVITGSGGWYGGLVYDYVTR